MLNKLDDFPIHQTPEPIAHAATSDRNVYDRTWFNGYAATARTTSASAWRSTRIAAFSTARSASSNAKDVSTASMVHAARRSNAPTCRWDRFESR